MEGLSLSNYKNGESNGKANGEGNGSQCLVSFRRLCLAMRTMWDAGGTFMALQMGL